jgi:hypothetical protein
MLKNKYRNEPCVIDGIKFASKKEGNRYFELKILQRARQIQDLRIQVPFELVPAQRGGIRKELPVIYVADFVYTEKGKQVIEDTKGMRTKDYIIKRKMMKMIGCEVTEI